jgi:hypothetical protein
MADERLRALRPERRGTAGDRHRHRRPVRTVTTQRGREGRQSRRDCLLLERLPERGRLDQRDLRHGNRIQLRRFEPRPRARRVGRSVCGRRFHVVRRNDCRRRGAPEQRRDHRRRVRDRHRLQLGCPRAHRGRQRRHHRDRRVRHVQRAGRLVRLNSDGTIDAAFSVGSGLQSSGYGLARAVDGSGDVFVGGSFVVSGTTLVDYLARYSSTGEIR